MNVPEPAFVTNSRPQASFSAAWNLTAQETTIVNRLLNGEKYKEIAHQLQISEHTVKTHVRRIFDKSGVQRRIHLLNAAQKLTAQKSLTTKSSPEWYLATPLTRQESRIVVFIAKGKRNKEIAEKLSITEQVVKNYIRNIFDKFGVHSRDQVAIIYNNEIKPALAALRQQEALAATPVIMRTIEVGGQIRHIPYKIPRPLAPAS